MPHVIKKLPMGVADRPLYYRIRDNKADWTTNKREAMQFPGPIKAAAKALILKHRACVIGTLEVVPV